MSHLVSVVHVFSAAALVATSVAAGRLYAWKRREIESRAEETARVLGDRVIIDQLALPLPTDPRWRSEPIKTSAGRTLAALNLGKIHIDSEYKIYLANLVSLDSTPALRRYAQNVWTAYQNTITRAAIEGS